MNLAARLESSGRPGHLLAQSSLHAQVPDLGRVVETDTIHVKGKSEAVEVSLLLP